MSFQLDKKLHITIPTMGRGKGIEINVYMAYLRVIKILRITSDLERRHVILM